MQGSVDRLNEKVRIQNGRVDRLEGSTAANRSWWQSISNQRWFPFLIAFLAAEIGGKSLGDLFNTIAQLFKPH